MPPVETRVWPIAFYEGFKEFLDREIGTDFEENFEYSDQEDLDAVNFHFVVFDLEQEEYHKIVAFEERLLQKLFSFEIFSLSSLIMIKGNISIDFKVRATLYNREKINYPIIFKTIPEVKKYFNELLDQITKEDFPGFTHNGVKVETLSFEGIINTKIEDWDVSKPLTLIRLDFKIKDFKELYDFLSSSQI